MTNPQKPKSSCAVHCNHVEFFVELEKVLDEHFPKVEEEGEEKKAMKRGKALMIFTYANILHSKILHRELAEAELKEHSRMAIEKIVEVDEAYERGRKEGEKRGYERREEEPKPPNKQ